jgi:hypothetical protein
MNIKWVTIKNLAEMTGYSVPAISQKIVRGDWPEGVMWKKSPDGRRQINLEVYLKWVEGTLKVA